MSNYQDLGAIQKNVLIHVFDGDNQYSPPVEITGGFNISVIALTHEGGAPLPAFIGTVSIERAFIDLVNSPITSGFIPPTEDFIWAPVVSGNSFEQVDNHPGNAVYRAFIPTGGYTQGKAIVRLGL